MVMFKRYGQLLLKMPSLFEESTLYHFPRETFVVYYIVSLFLRYMRCYRIRDPQN